MPGARQSDATASARSSRRYRRPPRRADCGTRCGTGWIGAFTGRRKRPDSIVISRESGLHPVTAVRWSWGESNPRPTLSLHAFSGRSLCRRSTRLRPLSQTPKSTSPAWEESRMTSRRRHTARFLDDARIRIGITYGLTDYRARLCSEGEVSALGFGTYSFAGSVHEITLHPRPASRGFTGAVETDQPRVPSCEGTAVTLCIFQLRMRCTGASQTTTKARPTLFRAGVEQSRRVAA